MAPPPNTTDATAIVVPSLDYSVVQTGIHDAGTTYTVWYKYVAQPNDGAVGMIVYGDATYRPQLFLYIDDTLDLLGSTSNNRQTMVPLIAGRTYYFECFPNAGNPTPANLTFKLYKQPREAQAAGDIFIRAASILSSFQNEGYTGLAAGIINPTTGIIKNFIPQLQVGESGDYLSTGQILFGDEYTTPFDKVKLYNAQVTLLKTITYAKVPFSGHPVIRTHRESNRFLVVDKGSAPDEVQYQWVTAAGVINTVQVLTAGTQGCTAAAASHQVSPSFIYFAGVGGSSAIKKWNTGTLVFDADLVAAVANYVVQDILVMSNGDLVVIYHRASIDDVFVRIYDSTGVLLRTWTAPVVPYTSVAPRLGYGNDASLTFWVFLHQSDGFSRFFNINVADVSQNVNITTPDSTYTTLDQGASPGFVHVTSDSCPFVLLLSAGTGFYPGIYIFEPNKTDDTVNNSGSLLDLKIPNPTFKTGLIG